MFNSNEWWKTAVIYQIYPRSFYDANNDGIGDLQGIRQRLDYIKSLSVDAIWLCPVCQSPDVDNGYDCSDYKQIDPRYGSLEDMRELIREASLREMGIIIDLVLNHTSDRHPWFQDALSGKDSAFRDYYIWSDGINDAQGHRLPPNDLQSNFGGSAWTFHEASGQFYLHLHDRQQPDLNWHNPQVREALYDVIQFWINEGVAGFRFDVIDLIGKEPLNNITQNGPLMHTYIQEMAGRTFARHALVTVGETWGASPEEALNFIAPARQELSMVFQFEPMQLDKKPGGQRWDLAPLNKRAFKENYHKWQSQLRGQGWNALFMNNHDLPRVVSRWGNDSRYRIYSAKALATVMYLMQGTPFIYQGEEIGMTNVSYEAIEDYVDVETFNVWNERKAKGYRESDILTSIHAKGRDNARTPMQWSSQDHGGFSRHTPWFKTNANYPQINVENQAAEPDSILNYYRALLAWRKESDVVRYGSYHPVLTQYDAVFAYVRVMTGQKLYVIANFSDETLSLAGDIVPEQDERHFVFHNYVSHQANLAARVLQPWECWVIATT